ncbi:hypothetical protein [Aurantiacibacter sp. MUD61]|uniref:hypothetical protein n=1 Tax=Aurantiacibacter sp. MUD61 TaxID=3009083 RepID=UPI0022F09BB0|nr:hypothetical protein [Aurantiacibacter sp. MUD61]
MMKKFITSAAVAGALVATPAMAQEAAYDRLPAPVEESEDGFGDNGAGLLIGLGALAVIILGIIIATGVGDDDDTLPASP